MIALMGIVGLIGIIAAASILRGWVLSVMWMWFIVPTFGLAPLSIPIAIGIGLILAFTTKTTTGPKQDISALAGTAFLYPLLLLGIAWIVKLFM